MYSLEVSGSLGNYAQDWSNNRCVRKRNMLKGIQAVRIDFFLLKVANIRCFKLIAVEIFHIIRK